MRCKNPECRDEFKPKVFLQKHCMEKHECIQMELDYKMDKAAKETEKKDKEQRKVWAAEKRAAAPRLYPRKYKLKLADACQLLARKIDNSFGFLCIDCGKAYGKQQDGGHFNSKGSNMSLAFNLHNIHSQKSDCNQNGLGGGKRLEYYRGLVSRYGKEYADMVDTGLQVKYKYIGLFDNEIAEKLAIVNKINRNFDTFVLKDGVQAREMFNKIIGIYV
jgi:hypothetical protein